MAKTKIQIWRAIVMYNTQRKKNENTESAPSLFKV